MERQEDKGSAAGRRTQHSQKIPQNSLQPLFPTPAATMRYIVRALPSPPRTNLFASTSSTNPAHAKKNRVQHCLNNVATLSAPPALRPRPYLPTAAVHTHPHSRPTPILPPLTPQQASQAQITATKAPAVKQGNMVTCYPLASRRHCGGAARATRPARALDRRATHCAAPAATFLRTSAKKATLRRADARR